MLNHHSLLKFVGMAVRNIFSGIDTNHIHWRVIQLCSYAVSGQKALATSKTQRPSDR